MRWQGIGTNRTSGWLLLLEYLLIHWVITCQCRQRYLMKESISPARIHTNALTQPTAPVKDIVNLRITKDKYK